ncbi:MAG: polysaccharide deacetylase family protein [Acidobacteriota bacterium]
MSRRREIAALAARAGRLSGLLGAQRLRRRRRGAFRAFVLEYHAVCPGPAEPEGAVSIERLRRHVRWLLRHGFHFDTVAGLAERLRTARRDADLGADRVALSFDDGYADNHDLAFPALRAEGAPATVYLVSGFLDGAPLWFDIVRRALDLAATLHHHDAIDRESAESLRRRLGAWPPASTGAAVRRLKQAPAEHRVAVTADAACWLVAAERAGHAARPAARAMTWAQARRLRDAGWELGAHTVTHPILSRLDAEAQEREILDSRRRIDERLGAGTVRTFAVPNGSAADYDATTREILAGAGFRAACTTRRGANRPGDDLLQLRRHGVGAEPTALLEARLGGWLDDERRAAWRRARRRVAASRRTSDV